jgi:murein L,D-transpeptidase YcbB/YkuD
MTLLSARPAWAWIALVSIQFAGLGLSAGWEDASAAGLTQQVSVELKRRLDQPERQGQSFCRKEALCGQVVLARFYRNRNFEPAWMDGQGRFLQAGDLVESIRDCSLQGLKPDVYQLATIEAVREALEEARAAGAPLEPGGLADLDLLLTDVFLIYGSQLLSGSVDPETIHPRWLLQSREADLSGILQAALEKNEVRRALEGLLPQYPEYTSLRHALQQYRGIAEHGGWPLVPEGPTLHKNDRDPRVGALRARLVASGDLGTNEGADPEVLDDHLEGAVRKFQGRHGLTVDGAVGRATLAALNVPVEARVRQIEINMERWRWLPDDLGSRHILVNTADFSLEVVEEGESVLAMRVVAGRKARRTPVLSGKMTYLVLNPYWHVPHKLAVQDILPKIENDPGYLDRQGIRVFESWEEFAPEIPRDTIDWSSITEQNFFFKLRQDAGPTNALGRVKFMFPNKFAVYLHDTPSRYMFKRNQRDFSSGCIRVEGPIDLAAYVLRSDPKWTREGILSAIESGENRIVWLPEPIPVHVLYWTAWVDRQGALHFRRDVYERDGPLDRALGEGPLRYQ